MMRRQCHLDLASSRSLQDHLLLATHSQNFASELRGQTYARNFLIATYGHIHWNFSNTLDWRNRWMLWEEAKPFA